MFLYVLENSLSGMRYIGITDSLNRRVREHNRNGQHFTSRLGGDWRLLYSRWFGDDAVVRKEEARLKKAKNKKYVDWYFKSNG